MGDIFKEQIVKRKPTARDTAIRLGLIMVVVLIIMVAILLGAGQFVVVIAFAVGYGAWFVMGFLDIEYEYVFTNGDLDIDVIYRKSRRKRLFNGHVNTFEIMAHVEDMTHAGAFQTALEVRDYSSGVVGPNTYAFLTTHKNKLVKIIIEPNEMMMKAISTVLTRRKLHIKP